MECPIVCPAGGDTVWSPIYGNAGTMSRLLSDFEEVEVLGEGAFGVVSSAKCKIDNQKYAIKKIILRDDYGYERATREVIAMAKLSHKGIVRYHTSWIEEGSAGVSIRKSDDGPMICIKMELCFGTLDGLMRNGLLRDEERIWKLFRQLVEAVSHIHEFGITHGDLSPRNIFLSELGDVKIGDFGFAKISCEGAFKDDEFAPETIYTAPEMTKDKIDMESLRNNMVKEKLRTYSLKSDIYSLGFILAEMFVKVHYNTIKDDVLHEFVMEGTRPACLEVDAIHPGALPLVRQMTATSPDLRPTATDILQAVDQP